jgi:hypothetical protein
MGVIAEAKKAHKELQELLVVAQTIWMYMHGTTLG